MIATTSLADAQVLIVNLDSLTSKIIEDLASYGVQHITIIGNDLLSATIREEKYNIIREDPAEYLASNNDFFKSFHLVLVSNAPRSFEVALSHVRWPRPSDNGAPDLPIIVMRGAANACKMRSQYRELPLIGGGSSKFIDLETDLLPWTDDKHRQVVAIVEQNFTTKDDIGFEAYWAGSLTVINFHDSAGSWPGKTDEESLKASLQRHNAEQAAKYISEICEGGLAAADQTIAILARVVSLEARTLITGDGQPVNNIQIQDIIRIAYSVYG